MPIYVDRSLEGAFNLTCGANKDGYHHFGFKPDRDLKQFKGFHDLRMATDGDACTRCGKGTYQSVPRHRGRPGVQAGHEVLDVDGAATSSTKAAPSKPMVMGCYGIGITRTIAAVIEQSYDADGIIWPWPVAPFTSTCSASTRQTRSRRGGRRAERELEAAGFEVLHDDRDGLSPGVKFKDADLLGMPLRVVIGAKGLKDGTAELRDRRTKEMQRVPFDQLVAAVTTAGQRF